MINLRQPSRLLEQARALHLGVGSTASLFAAYYFGRRAWLKRFYRDTVVLNLPDWGKVPIRTNGYDHGLLDQIFRRQEYRVEAEGILRVLDLGANIGMATVYLNRRHPGAEFACVEPSPQNVVLLERAIALNGIRGRVFKAAVGCEEGTVELHLSALPDCNSIYPVSESGDVVRVPKVTVPGVMREMGWDGIDLLKIDIEGAEKEVLGQNNHWLSTVRVIAGEGHIGVGYPYRQLVKDLQEFGFEVTTLIEETTEYGASFLAVNRRWAMGSTEAHALPSEPGR